MCLFGCAIFNVYLNNFDKVARVIFYLFFFLRERVSHHSRIGLHRGLNRTKFMACGNHRTVKKCKSTKYKCLVFFF